MLQTLIYVPLIKAALLEDIASGDLTTEAIIPVNQTGMAELYAYAEGVLCGIEIFEAVMREVSPSIEISWYVQDGAHVYPDQKIATIYGRYASILTAERVAINFLQHLSGIATMTAQAVQAVSDTNTRILDTRKTLPGLRHLQKYAVAVGGGINHRGSLGDGFIVKKNHIRLCGGIGKAISFLQAKRPPLVKFEVEVCNLADAEEAIQAGADLLLVRHMSIADIESLLILVKAHPIKVEVGLADFDLQVIRKLAESGADYISLQALTNQPIAMQFSLMLKTSV